MGIRGTERVDLGEDAAGDSVVEVDEGGIGVWVDREMFGDGVGGGVEHEAVAGESAEDGERVFGIVCNVGIEEDKHVREKSWEVEGLMVVGRAVPLGRGQVEDDREMGGGVHNPNLARWRTE